MNQYPFLQDAVRDVLYGEGFKEAQQALFILESFESLEADE
jgi:hypothetical protein